MFRLLPGAPIPEDSNPGAVVEGSGTAVAAESSAAGCRRGWSTYPQRSGVRPAGLRTTDAAGDRGGGGRGARGSAARRGHSGRVRPAGGCWRRHVAVGGARVEFVRCSWDGRLVESDQRAGSTSLPAGRRRRGRAADPGQCARRLLRLVRDPGLPRRGDRRRDRGCVRLGTIHRGELAHQRRCGHLALVQVTLLAVATAAGAIRRARR
jgi:hypothetical protein